MIALNHWSAKMKPIIKATQLNPFITEGNPPKMAVASFLSYLSAMANESIYQAQGEGYTESQVKFEGGLPINLCEAFKKSYYKTGHKVMFKYNKHREVTVLTVSWKGLSTLNDARAAIKKAEVKE